MTKKTATKKTTKKTSKKTTTKKTTKKATKQELRFTLNPQRLELIAEAAKNQQIQEMAKAVLQDVLSDPTKFAVGSLDSVGIKKTFDELFTDIRIPGKMLMEKELEELPLLWVHLDEVQELCAERQRQAEEAERQRQVEEAEKAKAEAERQRQIAEEAEAKAKAQAAKAAEEAKAKAEDLQRKLAAVGALSATYQAKQAEKEEFENRREQIYSTVKSLVLGNAKVDTNHHPSALLLDGEEYKLCNSWSLADELEDRDPKESSHKCAICGAEYKLGESFPLYEKDEKGKYVLDDDGKRKVRRNCYRLQFLSVVVKTEDGESAFIFTYGEKEGLPKKLSMLVCNRCTRMSRHVNHDQNLDRDENAYFEDAFPITVKRLVQRGEDRSARGSDSGPTLRTSIDNLGRHHDKHRNGDSRQRKRKHRNRGGANSRRFDEG